MNLAVIFALLLARFLCHGFGYLRQLDSLEIDQSQKQCLIWCKNQNRAKLSIHKSLKVEDR